MGIVIDGNKRDLFRIFATDGRFFGDKDIPIGKRIERRTASVNSEEDKMKEWNAKDNEANRQKVEQAKERINAKKIAPNK